MPAAAGAGERAGRSVGAAARRRGRAWCELGRGEKCSAVQCPRAQPWLPWRPCTSDCQRRLPPEVPSTATCHPHISCWPKFAEYHLCVCECLQCSVLDILFLLVIWWCLLLGSARACLGSTPLSLPLGASKISRPPRELSSLAVSTHAWLERCNTSGVYGPQPVRLRERMCTCSSSMGFGASHFA